MSILARDKKQLTYIYSSLSHLGKQVLGYIQGIDKKVEVIDIVKENLGDTIWVELADNLDLSLAELFTVKNNDSSNIGDTNNFSTDDWLKIINKNPELLQKPIAVNGDKVMLIAHRAEILKFFGVDSAGLKKGLSGESPTISSTTEDENFI
ncbi:arsenate reductase family protein [Flavivirga sp. 57AJ16]|uniref:arsenate reductase family protein n=1 Tax=Flavivirga sp. 57AJ16 TaxID=3025307 RepID=UPI0023667D85|nr:ArsC/Spx/MgsR family protein [Flavivirga sp. 57AJ16]MDD7886589.1 hypothetical protein [Flavivirga sp. 57AJ16]